MLVGACGVLGIEFGEVGRYEAAIVGLALGGDMPQPDVNVPTGSFTDKWYGE